MGRTYGEAGGLGEAERLSAGSERKIAKIVCRLIKRKQNLPINEMWQLSVNFIGARLAGDDDDDGDADVGDISQLIQSSLPGVGW